MIEELMRQKIDVDFESSALKAELEEARTDAYLKGLFMPPDQYRQKSQRLAFLKRESQRLQLEVALAGKAEQRAAQTGFAQQFVSHARLALDPALFQQLCDLARCASSAPEARGEAKEPTAAMMTTTEA